MRRLILAAIVLFAAVFLAASARAEGPFEGTWREGPMTIAVAVQSWGGDCGPRPQSTSTAGGGTFRISQEGDQLTFHMGRERTTRGCWSENRAVRRVSSSAQSGTWRIVCRTPTDDSRAETGTYTITATGTDQLSFRDVSAYDWQLNESRCVATITTTQNFTRVGGGQANTQPPPEEEEEEQTCTAGAPARVVLRPGRVELPPGTEQCFNARVVDANDCRVRNARISISLAEGSDGTLSGRCYTAPGGEAQARIVATSGALSAEARVAVRNMDLSEWIARRSESGSVGSTAPGEQEDAITAARVSTRARDEGIDLLWPSIGLGAAFLVVLVIGIVIARRPKKKRGIAGLPGVELSDPGVSSRPGASKPKAPEAPDLGDMICPECHRGYPPRSTKCAHDGVSLVPYKDFVAKPKLVNKCPVCGDLFPENVKFCGKDGVNLERADG